MLTSNSGTTFALVILGLTACFGYYWGFMVLATRRAALSETLQLIGRRAIAVGLLYLAAAIVISAVVVLFYFSL